MRIIHKYELSAAERQRIQLPVGSKILSVHNQFERPVLWVEVEKGEHQFEPCEVSIVLTGAEIPADAGAFVGTILTSGGHYVLHVFVAYPVPAPLAPAGVVHHG